MGTNWIVLLTFGWFAWFACPARGEVTCREVQLARSCETLCKRNRYGVVSCELRIAVLLPADPSYDISLPKVLPVLGKSSFSIARLRFTGNIIVCDPADLALHEARSRGLLPPWLKLKFLSQDDHCDATYAQIGAIDSFSNCVHLFLGPACDYCVGKLNDSTRPATRY